MDDKIIEIHDNTRYVRKSDSEICDKTLLYSYLASFPNGLNTFPLSFSLTDSTYYLRIPSFGDKSASEIVVKNWNEIISHPSLIIDIRYNGGCQDRNYQTCKINIYKTL